ncbi:MAG: acyl-CoA/acyl-ACP dehydrogenase [Proteobacteria bacterium]|nr:acyl-CoA/acyl-ACP dehydrogenase [Pseudomonadota bacterium]
MISRSEIKAFTQKTPSFDDTFLGLKAISRQPSGMSKETRKVIALARKFNAEVVRPLALSLDITMQKDPTHIPMDFVNKANEWGFYTLWIPKLFGGQGYNLPSISFFLEEIGSECLAMANLIGVHYLGFAVAVSSWSTGLINRLCQDTINGEKTGKPCLMSLALTEPGAGTDVEETDLMDKGSVACHAKKVEGGYVVNGTKVFISNGHLSHWHMLIAFEDLKKPSASTVMLAVETGMKGFSFGRMEKKMGQKGCPASELMFDNCFIPDANVLFNSDQGKHFKRSLTRTNMQIIDFYFAASRAAVGAFGIGAARGAYNLARDYVSKTEMNGSLLINQEWVQSMLAEMYKNVLLGRLAYNEANYATSMHGMYKLIQQKQLYYITKYTPRIIFEKLIQPVLGNSLVLWLVRKFNFDMQTDEEIELTSGLASLAKFAGTDAGIKNCHMALELMGQAGLRHDMRAEKCLRDAKLLQIYEGTNQLNRLNLFKCLIAKDFTQATVFEEN